MKVPHEPLFMPDQSLSRNFRTTSSIETLVLYGRHDRALLSLAFKVAEWTIANMQDPSGYFYFRKGGLIKNKVPLLHWGQATMLSALAALYRVGCRTR